MKIHYKEKPDERFKLTGYVYRMPSKMYKDLKKDGLDNGGILKYINETFGLLRRVEKIEVI